jgi:amino acid transporter
MLMGDKNRISVVLATAIGLGAIIGAGIFVLSGTAIALAGRNALIAFALVGIVALIVGFELSELGSLMPNLSGGSYSYAYKAFGSELGFVTGILLYFSYATAIAVVALGFGSYLTSLLGISIAGYPIAFAIILIFVLSVVNIMGIRKAAKADFGLVIVKIAILAMFIAFAFIVAFSMKHLCLFRFPVNINAHEKDKRHLYGCGEGNHSIDSDQHYPLRACDLWANAPCAGKLFHYIGRPVVIRAQGSQRTRLVIHTGRHRRTDRNGISDNR